MTPHSEVSLNGPEEVPILTNGSNGVESVAEYTNGSNGTTTAAPVSNGSSNGTSNGARVYNERSKYLEASPLDSEFDLVCAGFGPASIAVAIAMNDALAAGEKLTADGRPPKVLFLEKQPAFAWHPGMLLPGAHMQISFIKDLATLRDPRSEFTFLNYVHRNGRLIDFTNLDTFLPSRAEFEDYLRWCSSFFDHLAQYNSEVLSVAPVDREAGAVKTFNVQARNAKTGEIQNIRSRHVMIAAGGQASMPKSLPLKSPRVLHSSQFATYSPKVLSGNSAPRVAVIGGGQSSAEIFNTVQNQFPNSKTYMIMRQEFLRPSDDSPFVNGIFDPDFVNQIYPRSAASRESFIHEVRATNYGVVRLDFIEHLYKNQYEQKRVLGTDEKKWPHRILAGREIASVDDKGDKLEIRVQKVQDLSVDGFIDTADEEVLEVDLVVAATGYKRTAHIDILKDTWNMLPKTISRSSEFTKPVAGWNVYTEQGERKLSVGRDYKVKFNPGTVADDAGVWLQGCNEGTHGLSDTLLSVLATRSGEMVNNIFKQ